MIVSCYGALEIAGVIIIIIIIYYHTWLVYLIISYRWLTIMRIHEMSAQWTRMTRRSVRDLLALQHVVTSWNYRSGARYLTRWGPSVCTVMGPVNKVCTEILTVMPLEVFSSTGNLSEILWYFISWTCDGNSLVGQNVYLSDCRYIFAAVYVGIWHAFINNLTASVDARSISDSWLALLFVCGVN